MCGSAGAGGSGPFSAGNVTGGLRQGGPVYMGNGSSPLMTMPTGITPRPTGITPMQPMGMPPRPTGITPMQPMGMPSSGGILPPGTTTGDFGHNTPPGAGGQIMPPGQLNGPQYSGMPQQPQSPMQPMSPDGRPMPQPQPTGTAFMGASGAPSGVSPAFSAGNVTGGLTSPQNPFAMLFGNIDRSY